MARPDPNPLPLEGGYNVILQDNCLERTDE
jgi:hypothetical protein